MKSRIQRSRLNRQHLAGTCADRQRDSMPVLSASRERLQNEQVECPLQDLNTVLVRFRICHSSRLPTTITNCRRVSTTLSNPRDETGECNLLFASINVPDRASSRAQEAQF